MYLEDDEPDMSEAWRYASERRPDTDLDADDVPVDEWLGREHDRPIETSPGGWIWIGLAAFLTIVVLMDSLLASRFPLLPLVNAPGTFGKIVLLGFLLGATYRSWARWIFGAVIGHALADFIVSFSMARDLIVDFQFKVVFVTVFAIAGGLALHTRGFDSSARRDGWIGFACGLPFVSLSSFRVFGRFPWVDLMAMLWIFAAVGTMWGARDRSKRVQFSLGVVVLVVTFFAAIFALMSALSR